MDQTGCMESRRFPRGVSATTRAPSRQLRAMHGARRRLDDRAWNDAVDTERLIRVFEWARAHELVLRGPYEIALTPELLDIVERVPYAEIGISTPAIRMERLVRFVERLLERRVPCRSPSRAFELAAPLSYRPGIGAVRLRAYVDSAKRRVALCTDRGEPYIEA